MCLSLSERFICKVAELTTPGPAEARTGPRGAALARHAARAQDPHHPRSSVTPLHPYLVRALPHSCSHWPAKLKTTAAPKKETEQSTVPGMRLGLRLSAASTSDSLTYQHKHTQRRASKPVLAPHWVAPSGKDCQGCLAKRTR